MPRLRALASALIGSLGMIVAIAAAAAAAVPAPAEVLLTDPGFGLRATGDEPLGLGTVVRHFEGPGIALDLIAIPVEPPIRARQLFRIVAAPGLGSDRVDEPELGLAVWVVEDGTQLGGSPGVRLFFATEQLIFSAQLVVADDAGIDPVDAARRIARRQLDQAGGPIPAVEEGAVDTAADDARGRELADLLPGDLGPLASAGTYSLGEELPDGVAPDAEVLQFLDHNSRGIVRLWATGDATIAAAASLTEYPLEVFAAAALGTVDDDDEVVPTPNDGLDGVADVVTFVGTGSRADQVGASLRRGRFFVHVLVTRRGPVSVDDAAIVVAAITRDAAARLPAGASDPYELPGRQPTFVALAVSCGLVTGATLGATGVGRVRSRRARRRSSPRRTAAEGFVAQALATAPSGVVVALDDDARRLRRRAGAVLAGQLVAVNVGVGALSGDFGWTGVEIAVVALVAGVGFTAWWSRHERAALGPAVRRDTRILPRPAGAVMGILALAVLGVGVAYALKGVRYLVLRPTLAQLRWSDLFGLRPREVGALFAAGGLAVVVLGSALLRIARALGRSGTRRVLAADGRPPVLYLRSFDDDAIALPGIISARRPFLELFSMRGADPFEESVAWEFDTYGPVVAVGRPGRSLASLGAAREHLADDVWQAQVLERMAAAGAIAVATGETEGLRWEIGRIVEAGHLAKTVFVFPPVEPDAVRRRWDHTAGALARAGAVVGPLPDAPDRVHTAQLGPDGIVTVTVADRRDEATYRTAVDRAMARLAISPPLPPPSAGR